MMLLHSRTAGLVPFRIGGKQTFNLLNQHVGVARLHHDGVKTALTRKVELARV